MEISTRAYRPRRPRESPLHLLVSRHIEELLRVWPGRFERRHGPLRPVVARVLRGFIRCGDVAHGFARAWCGACRKSYLVAFSCRGRSFCPSCEKRRSLLWAEWLREEVLEDVPHRHAVMTIPRFLRRVFLKRRELLLELAQSGAEAIAEYVRQELGVCPGIVVSIATAGDMVQWHPHLHILLTDGGFSDEAFRTLDAWDGQAVMRLFRERLLARLVAKHAVSRELVAKVMAWRHPGFSAHFCDALAPGDVKAIEDLAGYVVRNPLSLKRLVYLDGQQAVICRGLRPNPRLGRNFESMDPLEWLARMTDHIPDPHCHRTLFYGRYANRARGARRREPLEPLSEAPRKKRCSPSWARLIAKVYQADPLVCRDCGGPLKLIAYLHDQRAIRQTLDHLGLTPPEDERPPPEVRYVPVDDEGRELTDMSRVADGS